MTNFSVTKNGKVLDPISYTWDEDNITFSSDEDGLVLDFTNIDGVTFRTGSHCTFNTGSDCKFNTGHSCTFKTGYDCRFITGSACTFTTGSHCTFKTEYDCTFKTGYSCIFEVGKNCSLIRYDVNGVTEIPTGKKIKLNELEIAGYTVIEKKKEPPTCNGKVIEIDGKKYKLFEVKE
jgi:hypothetical protein